MVTVGASFRAITHIHDPQAAYDHVRVAVRVPKTVSMRPMGPAAWVQRRVNPGRPGLVILVIFRPSSSTMPDQTIPRSMMSFQLASALPPYSRFCSPCIHVLEYTPGVFLTILGTPILASHSIYGYARFKAGCKQRAAHERPREPVLTSPLFPGHVLCKVQNIPV